MVSGVNRKVSFSYRMMLVNRSEGLCGPRAPAPKAFGLWTPAAELTCAYNPSWFPLMPGGTRIFRLAALCFWPGVLRTPARMRSIRGKPGNNPQGKRAFPSDFPGLSWARNPHAFVTPARQANVVDSFQRRNFARYGSRVVTTLAQVWGRGAPSVSLISSALFEW